MQKLTLHYLSLRLIVCFLLFYPLQNAIASSLIALFSSGSNSFLLQGIALEGVGSIEITLTYNATSLSNPQVIAGPLISGAMMVANPSTPGIVRIAIIHTAPISGNGNIATLTFDHNNIGTGQITSLSTKLTDIKGGSLAVLTQINNAPQIPNDTVLTALPSASATTIFEAIRLPEVQESPPEPSRIEMQLAQNEIKFDSPQDSSEIPQQILSSSKTETLFQKSTLDRFKEFGGKASIASLVSLFNADSKSECHQLPSVVLSDGKSIVTVELTSVNAGQGFADLSSTGAKLVNSIQELVSNNHRTLKLLPEKGAYLAHISFTQGKTNITCPLTVEIGRAHV